MPLTRNACRTFREDDHSGAGGPRTNFWFCFVTTQQRLFALLFGQPDRSFYLTELVKLANVGSGGVQRELLRLEHTGLVIAKAIGNQKHYQANSDSPVFVELTGIIKKTVGLKQPLLDALAPVEKKIDLAFIYGSVASGNDTSSSDIDLLVVSDELALADVFSILSLAEAQLGRQISPTLYNSKEFSDKRKTKKGFLVKVLETPVIELIGSIDG